MIKILILGGGFGGIRCALDLEKKLKGQVDVTLIDKNNYHLFTPALYEVASAYGIKKDPFAVQLRKTISMPYADIFENKNINFVQAEIVDVDIMAQRVKTKGEAVFGYDYLIFSLGSETMDFNVPGVREYAYQFKTLEDGFMINKKIEEMAGQMQRKERSDPFSILICGGGFTGIELAAELGCCSRIIKDKCKLKGKCSSITLFEGGNRILPAVSEKERKIILERLTKLGIIVMENSPIEEIGPNFVQLRSSQKVDGDVVIWTAGIKPNSLLSLVQGLPLTVQGKIIIDEYLAVKGFKNVYAVGDNIEFIDPKNQRSIPAMAYVAIAQGKIAAINISNAIRGKALKPYRPFYSVWIIPIGGKFAIAHLWGIWLVKGFWGWAIRELVDLRYMLSIFSVSKALEIFWNNMTIFSQND